LQLVSVTPAKINQIMKNYFVFRGLSVKAKFVTYSNAREIAGKTGTIVRADKVSDYLFRQMRTEQMAMA